MSGPERASVSRRLVAEAVGSGFLLAAVVGSGIMGERLAGGNVAVALLANTLATGAALLALILAFGPISGAHLNPAVTLAAAAEGGLLWREVPLYISAQIIGAFGGVAAAHAMFEAPLFSASRHARSGPAQVFSEFVATFGLLAVIWGCARLRSSVAPFAVAAYITAAYWFTAWGLAIGKGLKVSALATMIAPYPTFGEINKKAAGSFYSPKLFSTWPRRLVRLLARFG